MLCARDQDFVRRFIAGETRTRLAEFAEQAAKRAYLKGKNPWEIRNDMKAAENEFDWEMERIRQRRKKL